MQKTVTYGKRLVSVSDEVAEYLESDRRRQAAEERRDRRRLSKDYFDETLPPQHTLDLHGLEDEAIKNLELENLRNVVAGLTDDERRLIRLYFTNELSMEKVGKAFGVSKMAISKRLRKLYAKMRSSL